MTRANRRGTRTQANQRYLCDRGRNRQGHGCEPGQGCRLSRRQGQVVRLLRRPDDEGDAGQGQSAGGQRAVEEGAGMNLLALASVLMLAAVPAVAQDAPGRTPIAEAEPQSDATLPRVAIETSAGKIGRAHV